MSIACGPPAAYEARVPKELPLMRTCATCTHRRAAMAYQWLEARAAKGDRVKRALLSGIDGHRNVIELESFARAMGLESEHWSDSEAKADRPVALTVGTAGHSCLHHGHFVPSGREAR